MQNIPRRGSIPPMRALWIFCWQYAFILSLPFSLQAAWAETQITRAEAMPCPIKNLQKEMMGFGSSWHWYSIYKVDQQDLKIRCAKKTLKWQKEQLPETADL